jgi:uncharacterized small protein (DUF1192 family)
VKQDASQALVLESIAEINARLRILDEANARLEAATERQLELLKSSPLARIRCSRCFRDRW